jgi:thiamine biosynthesis lipoprotein
MNGTSMTAEREVGAVPDHRAPDVVSAVERLMGGQVGVFIRPWPGADAAAGSAGAHSDVALRDARRTVRRISSWADRLTRFSATSELSRLNADPAPSVRVGATLAAVLARAVAAGDETDGIVDATLLDARLAAESPAPCGAAIVAGAADRTWTLETDRRERVVTRMPGVRFDLDGIAKGWIADRAAASLATYPAVVVDADGDLAIALTFGASWRIGVADPRDAATDLATLEVTGLDPSRSERFGLATSGTSVHRWAHDGRVGHHLIDPRTGRPAVTDVVQATVLADSASAAEIAAKQVVIVGSAAGAAVMDRPGVRAVIVLTDDGRVFASPSSLRWLS